MVPWTKVQHALLLLGNTYTMHHPYWLIIAYAVMLVRKLKARKLGVSLFSTIIGSTTASKLGNILRRQQVQHTLDPLRELSN